MITFRKRDIGCWRTDGVVVDPIVEFESLKKLFDFLRDNLLAGDQSSFMIDNDGYVFDYCDKCKIVIGYIEELKKH